MVTLLLHQQCVAEALAQFRAHIGAFRQPPLPPPPAAAAAHAAWLVRQYTVMAQLLSQRVDAGLLPPQVRIYIFSFFFQIFSFSRDGFWLWLYKARMEERHSSMLIFLMATIPLSLFYFCNPMFDMHSHLCPRERTPILLWPNLSLCTDMRKWS